MRRRRETERRGQRARAGCSREEVRSRTWIIFLPHPIPSCPPFLYLARQPKPEASRRLPRPPLDPPVLGISYQAHVQAKHPRYTCCCSRLHAPSIGGNRPARRDRARKRAGHVLYNGREIERWAWRAWRADLLHGVAWGDACGGSKLGRGSGLVRCGGSSR